jgi:hypothetical protein
VRVKPNSKDGYVWRVVLKTKSTVLERPVDKIVLLEASNWTWNILLCDNGLKSII